MAEMTPRQSYPEASMRDFYNVLFRHKKKIIVFFFSVMIVVTLGTFLGPEVYKSECELLVRLGRESVTLDPTATTGQVVNIGTERENEINSESEILKSRELAEKVVDAVGVKLILNGAEETLSPGDSPLRVARYWARRAIKLPVTWIANFVAGIGASGPAVQMRERELAIRSLMKHLNIETTKKSNIISISYETNNLWLAQDVLDKLVGFYLEKHINVHRTSGSYQFFNEQKEGLQSSLAKTEEDLKDLKNRTGTGSIPEQRRILLERIGGMQRELEETESAAAASSARVKALKASLAGLPGTIQKDETTGFANSAADGMRKQVYDLELKEQELLSTFTVDSIPVQEVRRQIKEGKALLSSAEQQKQVTTGLNENHQKIQLRLLTEAGGLSSLEAKAEVLKTQLERARGELNTLNDTEMRLAQLERDLETKTANYRKYSESLEQARIDQALEMEKISNISIVQPASYPGKPIRPRKLLNLALGFFLGIFGGLGLAFFSEYQDHSFKTPDDVGNRLNLPVLAALPDAADRPSRGRAPGRLLSPIGSGNALGDLLRLCSDGAPSAPGTIAFVSCRQGEGVSTTAALLARQTAMQGGGRVLLVDANWSSPCQHSGFGAKLSPGLSDLGSNGRTGLGYIQTTSVENVDVLSAGNGKQDVSASTIKAFTEALPALRREYSRIICDLPPLQDDAAAIRMAALMDGVVLVVEAEKTRWEVANRARESLFKANTNIIGVVLNRRRFHIPEWLYKTL